MDLGAAININWLGVADTTFWILVVVFGLIILGALAWVIWWTIAYKHRVIIKDIIKDRTVIVEDKARRTRDKAGIHWWKLWKSKVKIPEPPSESIEIGSKGRKYFFCYHVEEAGYIPIKDTKGFKKKTLERRKQAQEEGLLPPLKPGEEHRGYVPIIDSWSYKDFKENPVSGFDAFDTKQKSLLVAEFAAADRYKKKSIAELVMFATPFITLIIIIGLLLGFWGDVVKPFTENNQLAVKAMEKSNELLKTIQGNVANQGQVFTPENNKPQVNNTPIVELEEGPPQ